MKKLTRPVQKVNAPVLGLDVHQNLIAYCLLDRGGDEVASGSVGGSPKDLAELLERLAPAGFSTRVPDREAASGIDTLGHGARRDDWLRADSLPRRLRGEPGKKQRLERN